MTLAFVIVGPGRVGTALGKQLAAVSGYAPHGVAGKTIETVKQSAGLIGAPNATTAPWTITPDADIVFITTPDSSIADVCETISRHNGFKEGAVVLHCSGSEPSTILRVRNSTTVFRGSMHPLQSIAGGNTGTNPFAGINMAVEGDPKAEERARDIGTALGATVFTINTRAKTLYHAAAVMASNYLVTLMDIAFKLLETAGIDRTDAPDILWPLVQGTLSNIRTVGIPDALTGPIARGDTITVESHLRAMIEQRADILDIYKRLGRHTISIATAKGTITEEQALTLEALLIRPPEI